MHACMDGCMDVWMSGCMDVWMYVCMDGWMDGCYVMLCNVFCNFM